MDETTRQIIREARDRDARRRANTPGIAERGIKVPLHPTDARTGQPWTARHPSAQRRGAGPGYCTAILGLFSRDAGKQCGRVADESGLCGVHRRDRKAEREVSAKVAELQQELVAGIDPVQKFRTGHGDTVILEICEESVDLSIISHMGHSTACYLALPELRELAAACARLEALVVVTTQQKEVGCSSSPEVPDVGTPEAVASLSHPASAG